MESIEKQLDDLRKRRDSLVVPLLGFAMVEWAAYIVVAGVSFGGVADVYPDLLANIPGLVTRIFMGVANILLVWNLHSFYTRVVVRLIDDSGQGQFLSTALAPVVVILPLLAHYLPNLWVFFVGLVALATVGKNLQLYLLAKRINHPLQAIFKRWAWYGLIYALTSSLVGLTVYGVMSIPSADLIGIEMSFFGMRSAAQAVGALQTYTSIMVGVIIAVYYVKNAWFITTSKTFENYETAATEHRAAARRGEV